VDLSAAPIPGTRLALPPAATDEMLAGFRRVLESERLILGAETERFEAACRAEVGTRHAVAVSSGTAALEIVFRALGVAGRSVVVPANTFYATAAAVIRAGGEPLLADVGPDLLLDPASLEAAWRDDTCGAVVVHVGGMITGEIDAILGAVAERGGFVVEDAAQALGSTCPAGRAGAIGRAGAVSFYPTKIVTAVEGGVVTTDDDEIARQALVLRDQGKISFGQNVHVAEGYSWRLSELHAVVGHVHMTLLADAVAERRRIAAIYDERLRDSPIGTIPEPPGHRWNRYKYLAVLPKGIRRDDVRARLAELGVGLSGEVFAQPLNRQPVFEGRFGTTTLPAAEELCEQHVCLPISPDLTDHQADHVATAVVEAVAALDRAA
jgi:perosamine synthetase